VERLILGELRDQRPHRFAAIRDRIQGISEKMLTQTLRHLEEDGLISRKVFAEVPPHVEYQLTDLGVTLRKPLGALRDWSVAHASEIMAARDRYAKNQSNR
jgi:DNA-binding HxlR family transcriptional regulator